MWTEYRELFIIRRLLRKECDLQSTQTGVCNPILLSCSLLSMPNLRSFMFKKKKSRSRNIWLKLKACIPTNVYSFCLPDSDKNTRVSTSCSQGRRTTPYGCLGTALGNLKRSNATLLVCLVRTQYSRTELGIFT